MNRYSLTNSVNTTLHFYLANFTCEDKSGKRWTLLELSNCFSCLLYLVSKCLFIWIIIEIFIREAYKYSVDKYKYSFLCISGECLCGTVWDMLEMHGDDQSTYIRFLKTFFLRVMVCIKLYYFVNSTRVTLKISSTNSCGIIDMTHHTSNIGHLLLF